MNQVMITLVPVTVATLGPVTCRAVVEVLADSAEAPPAMAGAAAARLPPGKACRRGPATILVRHSVVIWRNVWNAQGWRVSSV